MNPKASAQFTGGTVVVKFRSPRHIRGVEFAELRCDRGDSAGVQPAGITTRRQFTDLHPLPKTRTNWTYYVRYKSATGSSLGVSSIVSVAVWNSLG